MTTAGTSISQGGYVLSAVQAPDVVGEPGTLAFTVSTEAGAPVTDVDAAHEQDLHLIVVRTDGTAYRHVHPVLDGATGTWSVPWRWDAAGTYRLFADVTPADGAAVTLSRTVEVGGAFVPTAYEGLRTRVTVDGYEVRLAGDLRTGAGGPLVVTVTKDGVPVTTLEPYLGAFGHLVALRDGDLAYLHVHALGAEATTGTLSGPDVAFHAAAPTIGRYFLYLDFQVDGQVRTASFVVDAGPGVRSHASHH